MEVSVKLDLKDVGCEGVEWMQQVQDSQVAV